MDRLHTSWLGVGLLLVCGCTSGSASVRTSLTPATAGNGGMFGADGEPLSSTAGTHESSGGKRNSTAGASNSSGGTLDSNGGSSSAGLNGSSGGSTSQAGRANGQTGGSGSVGSGGSGNGAGGLKGVAGSVAAGGSQSGVGGTSSGGGAANAVFPVRASTNGRYLEDQNGRPFRVHGDAIWDASVSFSSTELGVYLDDRRSRGFNTILVQISNPVKYQPNSTAPASKGANGALPFLKNAAGGTWDGDPAFAGDQMAHNPAPGNFDADFSSPNPAYFAWIDKLLTEAASRGILVVLTPCYLGFNNGVQDGWWRTLNNSVNTQAVSRGFGVYLGNRYKGFANILWEMGVDMMPPAGSEGEARAYKILEGIKAAGDTHLWTGHWKAGFLSTDEAAFAGAMNVQGVYTHGPYPSTGPAYGRSRLGYAQEPHLPTILLETNYEGEHGATSTQIREFMWGAALSTTGGVIFGNAPLWNASSGWQNLLASQGARDMQRLGTFLDSLPWYQFVPAGLAGSKSPIVSGGGTYTSMPNPGDFEVGGDDWIVPAITPDARRFVAYVPDPHTGAFTVDMSLMAGSTHARWFDPANGGYTEIGTFPNSGTKSFSVPGKNSAGSADWVLVFDVP